MPKIPQSKQELIEQFKEQIGFLKKSCALFDAGDYSEAKRLCATLRVLLHDKKQQHSLLSQLNKKNITFYDSASDWDPRNMMPHHGLVGIKLTANPSTVTYYAHFHQDPISRSKCIPFDKWWEKIVIDDRKNKFTRKSLILSIAEMDGGVHIDPGIDESYQALTRLNSVGWKIKINGQVSDLKDVELHSIRQIAEEFLESLKLDSDLLELDTKIRYDYPKNINIPLKNTEIENRQLKDALVNCRNKNKYEDLEGLENQIKDKTDKDLMTILSDIYNNWGCLRKIS